MWTMAVKVADHPHGTFVVGEKATFFGHEHTVLRVSDHPVKYLVTFDGTCHRHDGKQRPVWRFIVPNDVHQRAPVTLDAATLK